MPEPVLLLSGIQHFVFCRRQWALIHMEGCRAENHLTASGRVVHRVAHEPFSEGKGHMVRVYDLAVYGDRVDSDRIHLASEGIRTPNGRNRKADSIRIYNLGNRYQSRIEHFGAKPSYDPEGTLIL